MPPIDHELNLTTQAILTFGSWGLTAVVLIVAIRMGLQERTPFYALMVLAAMVGAFVEPLYDVATNLHFYSTEGMWTHFSAFAIKQPIWTHSGYAILYGSAAMFIARAIYRGALTANTLLMVAGVEMVMSCTFEIFGINGGAYTYWGPHEFRILQYPLVIGVLESAQVICFAMIATLLRRWATATWQLLLLFVLFPFTFLGTNFGIGWPTIIAINLQGTSRPLVATATLISIGFAVLLVRAAGSLLPLASGGDSQRGDQRIGRQAIPEGEHRVGSLDPQISHS